MAEASPHAPYRIAGLHRGYMAHVRQKRLYSGLMLALFVLHYIAGRGIAESRNAGGFIDGIVNASGWVRAGLIRGQGNRS